MSEFLRVPASSIKVGRRVREDLGDVAALAASIAQLGLLQPLVVRSDLTLVAGMRRLEAMTAHLGWEIVPALVAHNLDDERRALRAEVSENSQRLPLSPFEMVQRAVQLLQADGALSEESSRASQLGVGRDPADPKARLTGPPQGPSGDTDRRVAAALGMGYRQFRNAREIVCAAEEDPEHFGDLALELHVSRNVAGTYRHYKARRSRYEQEALREAPEEQRPPVEAADPLAWLPRQGPCDLLMADPPPGKWHGEALTAAEHWVPEALRVLRPTARAYIFVGARPQVIAAYVDVLREALVDRQDLVMGNMLVWAWRNLDGPPPDADYRDNWCGILHVRGRSAPALDCPVMADQMGVQKLPAPEESLVLGREKPYELMARLVRAATKPGGRVLVPWAGTGEAVLAAHKLGRTVAGCEPDEDLLRRAEAKGCRVVGE